MPESPLNSALRQFEAVEANLDKAERLLDALMAEVPQGIAFGTTSEYDQNWRDFHDLIDTLPKIDGWNAEIEVMDLDAIARARLDAQEFGDIEYKISVEQSIEAPLKQLGEYRHRFNKKRRALVRDAINIVIDRVDGRLRVLRPLLDMNPPDHHGVDSPEFEGLKTDIAELRMLLGSSIQKPQRWSELNRHLAFGQYNDLYDIIHHDWPAVSASLRRSMYGDNEAIPIDVEDIGALVNAKPQGSVATRLKWEVLTDDDFERLIFSLISSGSGYQNPEWLMRTNAPDRGRDLSVYRVHEDALSGTMRLRVIIQCKHWQSKSVNLPEIAALKEQMKLWEPPRVDVCVVATSGRFTADAVAAVEKHNQADAALRIEMWPESHLERLLASRPGVIAEFRLR
jgi:hypothetical protein